MASEVVENGWAPAFGAVIPAIRVAANVKVWKVGVLPGDIEFTGGNGFAVEIFDKNGNSLGVILMNGFVIVP